MFRMRRYRVFVILAALSVFLLYRFSQPSQWESSSSAAIKDRLGLGHQTKGPDHTTTEKDTSRRPLSRPQNETPNQPKIPHEEPPKVQPPAAEHIPKPVQEAPKPKSGDGKPASGQDPAERNKANSKAESPPSPSKTENGQTGSLSEPANNEHGEIVLAEGGEGRLPIDHLPTNGPKERWTKRPEHYPVPTESIIPLPTGKGKTIPKIQHTFKKETSEAKSERQQQLATIKEAFLHAWNGYKTKAWGRDELKPVTGSARNTFNGWSATLVDAMDTMWIMGLTKEFEESVEFVKNIDFYASTRSEIPIFETTIRYLGGLLGAYDVSDGKYPVLLDRARDLGDFIMAAFDTPNRMPLTYYPWKEAFASQPHRASRAVLAEIGSLQMEFTRLAQLTGNSSYYDAITRVVDAMEVFQSNTSMPGIWPADIDTSGCAKSNNIYPAPMRNAADTFIIPHTGPIDDDEIPLAQPVAVPVTLENPKGGNGDDKLIIKASKDALKPPGGGTVHYDSFAPYKRDIVKRQNLDAPPNSIPDPSLLVTGNRMPDPVSTPIRNTEDNEEPCLKWGLSMPPGLEKYTLGSTADSAFEYLPKQYLLLAGQVEKYREMYERAMDVANDKLIFRIMIPDEKRELLVAGEAHYTSYTGVKEMTFKPDQTHLVCFVGGMFAMGAKMFDRPNDLDIAAKLTDACVWSYESTTTGIMPETFEVVRCDSRKECSWNETKWHEEIDPMAESRLEMYESQMKSYREQMAEFSMTAVAKAAAATPQPVDAEPAVPPTNAQNRAQSQTTRSSPARAVVTEAQDSAREPPKGFDRIQKQPEPVRIEHTNKKRQDLGDINNLQDTPSPTIDEESTFTPPTVVEDAPPSIWSPTKPQSRAEYVKSQIDEYKLKPGMRSIRDARYLLRPEALESVFYMHRISGSPYWRKAGWKMVSAMLKTTRTQYGHSSIRDVFASAPAFEDEMESFWLAETLKYAWLLFEDESKWSLDEWVLNTEAHLFKRPKA
ncbi:seven-hairpin glycosidase [Microthyrium microscopicum]|uniref:alpha-1,2-Mannosidase n=1 Tax=Microthyrium microscopicum TaxID=703497 RepID=A0A6A6U081_9PEZI|nr:seven-hairpin glycosidase [Microthyrium microscopicum]